MCKKVMPVRISNWQVFGFGFPNYTWNTKHAHMKHTKYITSLRKANKYEEGYQTSINIGANIETCPSL